MLSSADGMRTPLSSCHTNLAFVLCGDGDRCIIGSVVASGTLGLAMSRLVCDPVRGRRGDSDEGEMNAGDENWGRNGVGGRIPRLLDVLAGSGG